MGYRLVEKLVYLLFFVSGACGLIYEVVWGKYLSLFIGNTTHAHMIVLATFMGGLAAGSFVFGRIADAVRRPLKLYGGIEIGIGLYGVLYSPILEHAKELYFLVAADFQIGGAAHTMIKLPLAFATLILPTCLMGGTLPVLSRFFIHSLGSVGKRIALLYFINSFGAVAGTLIAGFYAIEHLGLISGLTLTGITNVGAGSIILTADAMLARRPAAVPVEAGEETRVRYDARLVRLAMTGIFLSGFTAMIYELVWFRVFAVVLESSTYSFSLMLAAFISGITAGSLAAGRVTARSRRLLFLFGACELAIAATVILCIPLYGRLPYYFWEIRYLLRPIPETFVYYNLIKFFFCFGIMVVPTFFFGMTLPLVSNIAGTNLGRIARKIGNVYAANTVGTLCGALCAGLILIPWLGLGRSLSVAFALNLGIGAAILFRVPDAPSPWWRKGVPAGMAMILLPYWLLFGRWDNARFALGFFRNREAPPPSYAAFTKISKGFKLRYYREDLNGNVAVLENILPGGRRKLSLAVNGKVDATSDEDVPTQTLVGQLPLMLRSHTDEVLLVGLGSGITAGAALAHPIRRLDCVEISPGVAEAGSLFAAYNNDVLHNPRFRLVVEDARSYVKTTRKRYDVVINEPSNPWMAGIGNLFTIEFFKDVQRILKPNGIMAHWFHRYETSDDLVATVVKTYQAVFPYTYIFQGNTIDMIILGSSHRLTPDFTRMAGKFRRPAVRRALGRIHVHDVPSLLALQMISPENIARIAARGEVNSDYRPILEYRAPFAFYLGGTARDIMRHDERLTTGRRLLLSRYLAGHPLTPDEYKRLLRFFRTRPTDHEALAYSLAEKYVSLRPDDRAALRSFAALSLKQPNVPEATRIYARALDPSDPQNLEAYAELLYNARRPFHSVFNPQRFEEARAYMARCIRLASRPDVYWIKAGEIAQTAGLYEEAAHAFTEALHYRDAHPDGPPDDGVSRDALFVLLAEAYYNLDEYDRAHTCAGTAFSINPENVEAAYQLLRLRQVERLRELDGAR